MSITTTEQSGALTSFIERAAKDESFDVQKFAELLRLQRDVGRDQARREFDNAMSAAQSEMEPVVRDATNSHLHNRYAKLETIDRAIRPIYTDHGFSVRYGSAPCPTEGSIRIVCTVAHGGGYFEEHYLDAPLGNAGAMGGKTATTGVQAIGSAVTYLRRYLLGMVFNVQLVDESDDDGEATRRPAKNAASTMRRPPVVSEDAPLTGRNAVVRDEILQRYATVQSRQSYLLATDELQVKIDWFRQHKPAVYNTISTAMSAAWERTAPAAEPEEEPEDDFPGDLPDLEIAGADKMASG
jgi:hypothetical protein